VSLTIKKKHFNYKHIVEIPTQKGEHSWNEQSYPSNEKRE